jgi:hypothetical protein
MNTADDQILPVRTRSWQGFMVKDLAGSDLIKLFSGPEFPAPEFTGRVEEFHRNIGATYKIFLSREDEQPTFYAKSFFKTGIIKGVKSRFDLTDAARSWRASQLMVEHGIPTPRPVAFMEQKVLGLRTKSVFVSDAVPDCRDRNLQQYFVENFDLSPLPRELIMEKREIIVKIAEIFRKAHAQESLYFPDFHPHNMVLRKSPGQPLHLFLVDFDEVKFKVIKDDRLKNLTSLGRNADKIRKKMKHHVITTGDALRFLKAYLGPKGGSREEVHALWREILTNWTLR